MDGIKVASIKGAKEEITLFPKKVRKGGAILGEEQPLTGVIARVEDGEALQKRVTVTRLVAIGVFALLAKKKRGGESFLTVEGPGFFWAIEIDRKKKNDAIKFAGKVNDQVKKTV